MTVPVYTGGSPEPTSSHPDPHHPRLPRRQPHGSSSGSRPELGPGLVVRLSPISGETPHRVLASPVWLPALLGDLAVEETALHNEYDTLTGGHFSQPAMGSSRARQLRTATLESLTMDFDPVWFVAQGQDPDYVRDRVTAILRARKPVHMLAQLNPPKDRRPEFDANITLRRQVRTLKGGEVDTRYLTVEIAEWRDPSVHRRGSGSAHHSRHHGVSLPTTHRLEATDTLASLSTDYYGTARFWRQIRDANGISKRFGQKTPLDLLPGRWRPGFKVKIPRVGREK